MKNILLLGSLLVSSLASAGIISYGDYTRDDTTNIVSGNGLEWLTWDTFVGQNVYNVLAFHSNDYGGGWQLATNTQVADLFNSFVAQPNYFDSVETTKQNFYLPDDRGQELGAAQGFLNLFNRTLVDNSAVPYGEGPTEYAHAFFGLDANQNGLINGAFVIDDRTFRTIDPSVDGYNKGVFRMYDDSLALHNIAREESTIGVALVRAIKTVQPDPSVVPEPSTLAIFALGLMGLVSRRLKKQS